MTYPPGTGVGGDNTTPRGYARLDDELLDELAEILNLMEECGKWSKCLRLVLIVLLAKADGGKRPIGLFPTPIRLWMRCRRLEAQRWAEAHSHPSIYAGAGMGAQRAAWQSAFQAESCALEDEGYMQSLLDLVKAFETIPHHLLITAAVKHDYNLWSLRLTLDAYRCERTIGCDGVYSRIIIAVCGIIAGSGSACTELHLSSPSAAQAH